MLEGSPCLNVDLVVKLSSGGQPSSVFVYVLASLADSTLFLSHSKTMQSSDTISVIGASIYCRVHNFEG